jgi:hypothetical protein
MSLSGLWLEPWVHIVPPNPKISKFLWGNSQTPATNSQDPLKKRCPPDRICSLTSSWICKNPHSHSWSVAGSVCPYTSPKPKNFEICVGWFSQLWQLITSATGVLRGSTLMSKKGLNLLYLLFKTSTCSSNIYPLFAHSKFQKTRNCHQVLSLIPDLPVHCLESQASYIVSYTQDASSGDIFILVGMLLCVLSLPSCC